MAVPVAEGVKLTEHDAVAPEPGTSEQVLALNEPATPLLVKLTVPDGDVAPELAVSVTVTVHELAWATTTGELQVTDVVVGCFAAPIVIVWVALLVELPPVSSWTIREAMKVPAPL